MKAIRDYVEVMFQDFPKTKKSKELKSNILDTMETKYEDLVAEGMPEQEAVGVVIGQFGNIDELKKEYDIEVDENAEYMESYEAEAYAAHKKRSGILIGISVAAIIFVAGIMVFVGDTEHETVSFIALLLVVACAVMVFINVGMQSTKYKNITEGKYRLESNDLVKYQAEYNRFLPSFQIAISIGVLLCIISATSPLITEDILHLSENSFALIMFPLVAIAVYLFIDFGIRYSMYNTLINPEKIKEEQEASKFGWLYGVTMPSSNSCALLARSKFGWLYGVTMPLAAMAFLFIGFVYNAWHPGWIVFPVTAIVTSAIVMIMDNTRK